MITRGSPANQSLTERDVVQGEKRAEFADDAKGVHQAGHDYRGMEQVDKETAKPVGRRQKEMGFVSRFQP